MRIALAKKNRAFAVIIALVAVTVLTLLAGAFAYAMKIETKLAANTNNDEEFYWMARGGVEKACWQLAQEGNQPFSSKKQYWADGPGDGPETNTILADRSISAMSDIPIGQGTVSFTFDELEEKINVNTADSQLLQQVLTAQGADPNAISVVSDSILDWIQPGDNPRPAGAKSEYYLGLVPSYYAKSAPIDVLEELLLIKGVTTNMYYGTPPDDNTPYPEHQLGFGHRPNQEANYKFGLHDIFTPFSTGKINLLTADEKTLECLPGLGAGSESTIADKIISLRDSDPPIRNIGELLTQAGVDPQAIGQMSTYLDIRGSTYEVHATATIGGIAHEYTAIVCRTGATVQVYNFYRSK